MKALPNRYKYRDFYKKFQDLDGISPDKGKKFELLEHESADFMTMSKNIMESVYPGGVGIPEGCLLWGSSMALMEGRFFDELKNKLAIIQKEKVDALETLVTSWKRWEFNHKWT